MQEPYVSLEEMISVIRTRPVQAIVQKRRHFNTFCYGELIGYKNDADRMRWDCIVVGYDRPIPKMVPVSVTGVFGIVFTETRNHKLAVRVDLPGFDPQRAFREAVDFTQKYLMKKQVACDFYVCEEDASSLSAT